MLPHQTEHIDPSLSPFPVTPSPPPTLGPRLGVTLWKGIAVHFESKSDVNSMFHGAIFQVQYEKTSFSKFPSWKCGPG